MTGKGRQFTWGQEQQQAFDEIKRRLVKLPVIHLPDNKGRNYLYSDTSKFAQEVLYIRFKKANQN